MSGKVTGGGRGSEGQEEQDPVLAVAAKARHSPPLQPQPARGPASPTSTLSHVLRNALLSSVFRNPTASFKAQLGCFLLHAACLDFPFKWDLKFPLALVEAGGHPGRSSDMDGSGFKS